MKRKATVAVTRNFENNLDDVENFLGERGLESVFEELLAQIFDKVVPDLQGFPELGRDFLARQPGSTETASRVARITARLGTSTTLREYIFDDYLLLYALRDGRVFLLALRHHLQLSYDLRAHWVPARP